MTLAERERFLHKSPKEMVPKNKRPQTPTGHLNVVNGYVWCNQCAEVHYIGFGRDQVRRDAVTRYKTCKEAEWSTLWTQFQEQCGDYWDPIY